MVVDLHGLHTAGAHASALSTRMSQPYSAFWFVTVVWLSVVLSCCRLALLRGDTDWPGHATPRGPRIAVLCACAYVSIIAAIAVAQSVSDP